jgi:hypothetical protein
MGDAVEKTWCDDKLAFEVWKYYGSVGGGDKDTMIKIVTWLLGFSAAIIAFYAKDEIKAPLSTVLMLVLGVSVSIVAAFTALLYGGYATWNWAIADLIAETYKWPEQSPSYDPVPRPKARRTAAFSLRLAKPVRMELRLSFGYSSMLSLYRSVLTSYFCSTRVANEGILGRKRDLRMEVQSSRACSCSGWRITCGCKGRAEKCRRVLLEIAPARP